MKNIIYLPLLLALMYVKSSFATTVGNDWCKGTSGQNLIMLTLVGQVKSFYAANVGDVLATFSANAELVCPTWNKPPYPSEFDLQIQVNAIALPGITNVCDIGIDGVGLQVTNAENNLPVSCGKWGKSVSLQPPLRASTVLTNTEYDAVRLIKTKDKSSLPMGSYPADFSGKLSANSFWPGYTTSTLWGNFGLSVIPTIEFKTCSSLEKTPMVDFGTVSMSSINTESAEKTFSIKVKDCGSENSAQFFHQYATMRFTSTNISTNGELNIDQCDICAKNVVIELKDTSGKNIDLNKEYKFSDGIATITTDNVSQNFVAGLISKGPITAGLVHSILTFEITIP